MATILVIILRVNRTNFVHFRTVNAQKQSPWGRRPPGPPIAGVWIRACTVRYVCKAEQLRQLMCQYGTGGTSQPASMARHGSTVD